MKTNKSFTKRLKVTRNGKIVGRKAGQNHFNAKERRGTKSRKGKSMEIAHFFKAKDIARFLPGYSPKA